MRAVRTSLNEAKPQHAKPVQPYVFDKIQHICRCGDARLVTPNPAVTIASSLSDTFAGIGLTGVVAFIAAQLVGMVGAVVLSRWLWER